MAAEALLCHFPGCPKYCSSKENVPETKKKRKESDVWKHVIEESSQSHSSYLENVFPESLELKRKINRIVFTNGWCTFIDHESSIIFEFLDVPIQSQ